MTANTIIITGDWFVDEYWFVVRHHSTVSSHTGQVHYRIYSKRNDPVKDLCGAGLVARVMYDVRGDGTQDPQLIGIGSWHPHDLNLIAHFIHAKCQKKPDGYGSIICNSYALMPEICDTPVYITLYNLFDPDHPFNSGNIKVDTAKEGKGTTIRVIRSYRFDGKKFEQLSRVDWEPDKSDDVHYNEEDVRYNEENVNKIQINSNASQFSIIVDDHDKGTVKCELIDKLNELTSKIWFVRTKNKNILFGKDKVPWLEKIEEINLLALGPEISTRFYPVGGLLTKDGNIARHAFEMIKAIIEKHKVDNNEKIPEVKNLILTSDKLELIFVHDKEEIYIWKPLHDIKNIELEKLNWTSAVFASLAYEMIIASDEDNKVFSKLKKAINNANQHSGVKDPLSLEKNEPNIQLGEPKIQPNGWKILSSDWESAMKEMGIIRSKYLQLWRATTDLPEYITCAEGKRDAIQRIWDKMIDFKMNLEVDRSCSILLEADPGVGKTFLARRLAEELGFTCIQHDITQMGNHEELLNFFDMVATAQADKKNKGLVVFVDEINASLDGAPVYGAFLSPLEAGYYIRRSTKFNLKPCIWIFAGTKNENASEQQYVEKLEDFRSRLSLIEKIDYMALQIGCMGDHRPSEDKSSCVKISLKKFNDKIQEMTIRKDDSRSDELKELGYIQFFTSDEFEKLFKLDRQARLEQVYLGAKMINQVFCDVREIEEKVLDIFYRLDPTKAPARRINRLAESLQNVQYGKVGRKNCTGIDWEKARKETDVEFDKKPNYIQLNFGG